MEVLGENKLYKIIGDTTFINIKDKLTQELQNQITNIMNFFEVKEINQLKIYLYDNEETFQKLTNYPYKLGPLAGAYNSYCIRIYCNPDSMDINSLNNCIYHEIAHTIYNYYVLTSDNKNKVAWLDEGLAQNLSNEKDSLNNDENLKKFIEKNIYSQDTIIPYINYLSKHGNKFGSFVDEETKKYNGYAWAYLIVRYLMETKTKDEVINIIKNPSSITILGNSLIEDTLKYFKKRLEVDNNDEMDKRTRRSNI